MTDFFKVLKWNTILTAIAMIICGILVFAFPSQFIAIGCIVAAVILAVLGVVEFFGALWAGPLSNYSLIKAAGFGVISAWLFTMPVGIISTFLNIIFAAILVMNGVEGIINSNQARSRGYGAWWVMLIFALVIIGLGISLLFVRDFAMSYFGFVTIFDGIILLIGTLLFGRNEKNEL